MSDQTGTSTSVQSVLNQALANLDGSSTVQPEKVETAPEKSATQVDTQKAPEGKEQVGSNAPKTIPYDRFKEVVDARTNAETRLKEISDKLEASFSRESKLREDLDSIKQDALVLERIRELAKDEAMRPHVVALDNALKGVEAKVEDKQITPQQGADDTRKLIENFKAEIEDQLVEERSDRIINEANTMAKEYIGALPVEYTEADKTIIGELWANRVDWNAIAEDPRAMSGQLSESLKATLIAYGEPKGATKQIAQDTTQQVTETPETTLKGILDKDWGALDDKGKAINSEEDFRKALAFAVAHGK